jgi:hypothetical protein
LDAPPCTLRTLFTPTICVKYSNIWVKKASFDLIKYFLATI